MLGCFPNNSSLDIETKAEESLNLKNISKIANFRSDLFYANDCEIFILNYNGVNYMIAKTINGISIIRQQ